MSKDSPPIATGAPTRTEDLPLPVVHYPPHYGIFFAFSSDESSLPVLCSCSRSALKNYVHLSQQTDQPDNVSQHFPKKIYNLFSEAERDPSEVTNYEEGVCHRCNLATPSLRYCHEMYGSKFKQRYGWYIRQAQYRLGFAPPNYLDTVCPPEIQDLIDRQTSLKEEREQIVERGDLTDPRKREIEKEMQSTSREISNYAENVARREFGHHEIGERWTSETILAQIVDRLLSEYEVVRHHRPDWLDGLEVDIWVPDLDLAIEYQGQQHFHPIEAWGGEEALEEQQKRDEQTRSLCAERNVELVEIDFRDSLTEEFVRQTLLDAGVPDSELSYN